MTQYAVACELRAVGQAIGGVYIKHSKHKGQSYSDEYSTLKVKHYSTH